MEKPITKYVYRVEILQFIYFYIIATDFVEAMKKADDYMDMHFKTSSVDNIKVLGEAIE